MKLGSGYREGGFYLLRAGETKRPPIRPPACCRCVQTPLEGLKYVERVKGIEPSLSAWEAGVMPLYDTRVQRLTLYQMSGPI